MMMVIKLTLFLLYAKLFSDIYVCAIITLCEYVILTKVMY